MELHDLTDSAPVVCNDLVGTSDSPGSPGPARDTQPSEKYPSEVPISNEDTERTFRRRRHISYATLCFCFFFEGWNDASFGPLFPRIQSAYGVSISSLYVGVADGNITIQINYAIVSLIFVFESVVSFFMRPPLVIFTSVHYRDLSAAPF